jgi:hypothetical protein
MKRCCGGEADSCSRFRNGRKPTCSSKHCSRIVNSSVKLTSRRDYKGLKKLITEIKTSKEQSSGRRSSVSGGGRPSMPSWLSRAKVTKANETGSASQTHQPGGGIPGNFTCEQDNNASQTPVTRYGSMDNSPPMDGHVNASVPSLLTLPPPIQAVPERQSTDEMSDSTHTDSLHQRISPVRAFSDDIVG